MNPFQPHLRLYKWGDLWTSPKDGGQLPGEPTTLEGQSFRFHLQGCERGQRLNQLLKGSDLINYPYVKSP